MEDPRNYLLFNMTHVLIRILIYHYILIFLDTYVFEKTEEGKIPWTVAGALGPIYQKKKIISLHPSPTTCKMIISSNSSLFSVVTVLFKSLQRLSTMKSKFLCKA